MLNEELTERLNAIYWWHTMELAPGVVTRGQQQTAAKLANIGMPERLDGLTVLDVGAWDGYFSFEAERRGASRVLAVDDAAYQWGVRPGWTGKAGFDLAHEVLASRVECLAIPVLELTPETVGVFDLVLFLGILYHMRHPLLSLERMASVTGQMCIVETHVEEVVPGVPSMVFGLDALAGKGSDWWFPNPEAAVAMCSAAGFLRASYQSQWENRGTVHAWKQLEAGESYASVLRPPPKSTEGEDHEGFVHTSE